MYSRVAALLLIAVSTAGMHVSYADSFDDGTKAMDKAFSIQDQIFELESKKLDMMYQAYESEINRAWKKYTQEIEATWGKENAKTPSEGEWVSYSSNRKQRSSVDFENGSIQLEVQFLEANKKNLALAKQRLEQQMENLFLETPQEDPALQVAYSEGLALSEASHPLLLEGQLAFSDGRLVTKSNIDWYAKEIVGSGLDRKTIQTPEGDKEVYYITVGLVPNHLAKRAEPFLAQVQAMAERYDIPASLIFGIMQTESYFNPMARSHVPAYGLMQLVPRSGGRDSYEYVYKQDKILSASYLYSSDNNIELGSAYLKLLMVREMRTIKDYDTRMLCTIAAYNTGGGNVARAFIPGSRSIRAATKVINQMTFKQVYNQLRTGLPYEETREYVKKVWARMDNYKAWDMH